MCDAIDDINEVLASLAPSAAPALDDIDIDANGVNGLLGWGAANDLASYTNVTGIGSRPSVDIDAAFNDSGDRAGIINASTDASGTLNEDVTGDIGGPDIPFDNNAFGNGDLGTLKLELNGTNITTIDLTTAGATGPTDGTGFTLTAATSVKFDNGDDFDIFKYRTGSWHIDSTDMNLGWNYVRVIHTVEGDTNTNYTDWVVDGDTSATTYVGDGTSLHNLIMSGSKDLSGINYHTGGTADYTVTIEHIQENTYISGSSVTFTETNGTIGNTGPLPIGAPGEPTDDMKILDRPFTITPSGIRIIDSTITAFTLVNRTLQTSANSSTSSIAGILLDNVSSSSNDETTEDFSDESRRLHEGSGFDDTGLTTNWDETQDISDSGGGDYDKSIQVTNGGLDYPVLDFGSIANGPGGNPDYSSGVTGERTYYRYFIKASGSSSTFTMNFNGSGNFEQEGTLTTGTNEIAVSIKLPSETGWMDCHEDFASGQWDDGDGCRDAASNPGRDFNDWDLSVGTKSTNDSGDRVFIRITVPQAWTGSITNLTWAFN